MITPDTSSLVEYFAGKKGTDIDIIDEALQGKSLIVTPIVKSEILSDPKLPKELGEAILQLPCFELKEGFWVRVGKLRKKVLSKKRKANLADSLIAQACIDENLKLITRDKDFDAFKKYSDLSLYIGP